MHYRLSTKYNHIDTDCVYASNYPIVWMKFKEKRTLYENIKYTQFEDFSVPVPVDYGVYLKHWYGNDYMKRPDKAMQVQGHIENIW